MFGEKNNALKLVEGESMTLLDKDAQFEGKLTFDGKVQILGKFQGEIFSQGTLVIGEGAHVQGEIDIDTVVIQGKVEGRIRATTRIEMHPPALVTGEIAAPNLVISEGALFEGTCSMGRNPGQVLPLKADTHEQIHQDEAVQKEQRGHVSENSFEAQNSSYDYEENSRVQEFEL